MGRKEGGGGASSPPPSLFLSFYRHECKLSRQLPRPISRGEGGDFYRQRRSGGESVFWSSGGKTYCLADGGQFLHAFSSHTGDQCHYILIYKQKKPTKLKVHSYGYCRGKLRKRRRRRRSVSPPGAEDASPPPPPFRGRRARRNEGQAKDWLLARFRKRRMGLGRVGFDSWPTPDRKERRREKKRGSMNRKGRGKTGGFDVKVSWRDLVFFAPIVYRAAATDGSIDGMGSRCN